MFYDIVRLLPVMLFAIAVVGLAYYLVIPRMRTAATTEPLTVANMRKRMWMEMDMVGINDPFNKLLLVVMSVIRSLENDYTIGTDPKVTLDALLSIQIADWIGVYGEKYHIHNPVIRTQDDPAVDVNGNECNSTDNRVVVYCTINTAALGIIDPGGMTDCIIDFTYPYTTKYRKDFKTLEVNKRLVRHMKKCTLGDRSNGFIFRVRDDEKKAG